MTAWDYATYPSKVIIVSSTNCRSVAGSSTHKNDATGNGRPAPLLAEPRYGAAPQPYGEYLSVYLSVCPIQPSRLFVPNDQIKLTGSENRSLGPVFANTCKEWERINGGPTKCGQRNVVTEKGKNIFGAFICSTWKEKFILTNLSCGKYALKLSRKLFTFYAHTRKDFNFVNRRNFVMTFSS